MKGPRPAQGGGQTRRGQKKGRRTLPSWDRLSGAERNAKEGAKPPRVLSGMDAALNEYQAFKAAGMIRQWRERWRHFLANRNR